MVLNERAEGERVEVERDVMIGFGPNMKIFCRLAPAAKHSGSWMVVPVFLAFLWALPGCSGRKTDSGEPGDEPTGIGIVDPDDAVSPLLLGFEEREQESSFPESFRMQGESRMTMSFGRGEKKTLDEQFLIETGPQGVVHAKLENSREYGWEVYWRDDVLYHRNRYMPLQKRASPRGEAVDGAEKIWNIFPAYWRLLAGFIKIEPGGEETHRDRPARRFEMKLREKPLAWGFAGGVDGPRWRKTVNVSRLNGFFHLDDETAMPVTLEFEAEYTFNTADGEKVSAGISYKHEIEIPSDPLIIEIPEAVEAPVRKRESLDRRALLGRLPRPGWHRGGGPVRSWQQKQKTPARKPVKKKIKAE